MNSNFHTDIVFVDANALYDILALEGLDIPKIGACKNTNINYSFFKNKITKLLSENQIYILPVTIFELVSHFRSDDNKNNLKI